MKPSVLNFLLDSAGFQMGQGVQRGNALRQLLEELGVSESLVACDSPQHLRLALAKRQPARPEDGRHIAVGKLLAVFLKRPSRLDQPVRGICQALANLSGQVFADLDEGFIFFGLGNLRAWLRLGANDILWLSRFWFNLTSLFGWSIESMFIAHALNTHDASCMISSRSVMGYDVYKLLQLATPPQSADWGI